VSYPLGSALMTSSAPASTARRPDPRQVVVAADAAEPDVVARRQREPLEVLEQHGHLLAQAVPVHVGEVDPVPADPAGVGPVQTREQRGQRRLARAVLPHEGHDLAPVQGQ
jgi:hypothetical protein